MLQEKNHAGAFLVLSTLGHYSRIPVTVPSGLNLEAGAVVGITTAATATDPAIVEDYDNAAADGSEVVAGILYAAVDATNGDKRGVMVAAGRGHHVVDPNLLSWGAGIDAAEQTAALAAMEALGIFAEG